MKQTIKSLRVELNSDENVEIVVYVNYKKGPHLAPLRLILSNAVVDDNSYSRILSIYPPKIATLYNTKPDGEKFIIDNTGLRRSPML